VIVKTTSTQQYIKGKR